LFKVSFSPIPYFGHILHYCVVFGGLFYESFMTNHERPSLSSNNEHLRTSCKVQNVWLWSNKVLVVSWMCKSMKVHFIAFIPRNNWAKHRQSQIWESNGWRHGWCNIVPYLWFETWSQSNLPYLVPIYFFNLLHAFYFNIWNT
jgi:hypothetical protein